VRSRYETRSERLSRAGHASNPKNPNGFYVGWGGGIMRRREGPTQLRELRSDRAARNGRAPTRLANDCRRNTMTMPISPSALSLAASPTPLSMHSAVLLMGVSIIFAVPARTAETKEEI